MTFAYTIEELPQAAAWALGRAAGASVIAFYGEMGAGKTTLIKEICRLRGVADPVTSPTFALINEYLCANGSRICHFDFYRLKNLEEAVQIGAEEYFDSPDLCLVEWAEIAEALLPPRTLRLHLHAEGRQRRRIEARLDV